MTHIIYSPRYNMGFFRLERFLHPFDARKYGRAWRMIRREFGGASKNLHVRPTSPVDRQVLLEIHSNAYLDQLRSSTYVASALEIPQLRHVPSRILDWCVLQPMRWATSGTILGMREAVKHGFAVNLGGGFHHAKPSDGEGFCIYSDIGLAIHTARQESLIGEDARVAYVDLDAHQGNGVSYVFREDRRVFIFDMYNSRIYPCLDVFARERIDCDIPITSRTSEQEYLGTLRDRLPGFLDSISSQYSVGIAIYNAGTDVFEGDPLGRLRVSANGVIQRDRFVVGQLRDRGIPTLMVLSGGYTPTSYKLVASSIVALVKEHQGESDRNAK